MLKKIVAAGLILAAAGLMALVSYSFLTSEFLARNKLILRQGVGFFWEADKEPQALEEAPALGFLAPDFTLFDLSGAAITLSGLRGRPVLLNFWASWCPPCRAEMPDLQRFYNEYGDQVMVLGINWAEDPESVRAFLERYAITYTNLLDRLGKAFVAYRLTGVPTTFFIDEEGVIRGVWIGPLKSGEIAASFAKISKAFNPEGLR